MSVLRSSVSAVLVLTFVATSSSAQTQPATPGAPQVQSGSDELAKQLSNPVASLVSIPFQFNWEEGVGPDEDLRFVLNFQPVIPTSLNSEWNLITRFILPFVSQPPLVSGGSTTAGTSDIVLSMFLSPAVPRRFVWGLGPVFSLPTTSDPFLGSGKWSIGPTALVLKQHGPWTYGILFNQLWSFASTGNTERADVNQTFLQPFLAYNTKTAVTFSINSEATGNWESTTDENWTIPLNFLVSKVTRLGMFPFSVGGGFGVFLASPEGGPEWKLRIVGTVILPRGR